MLIACGGSGRTGLRVEITERTVVLEEFSFRPDLLSVGAGEEVTFTLTNEGRVAHNWVLLAVGVAATRSDDVERDDILFEEFTNPGGTIEVPFTAPTEPGSYRIVCTISGHLEAGMEGELLVREG
ncbi:MAG: plastocyanin/azurin family copper-binding protein [Acidimicrobiia bacterium]